MDGTSKWVAPSITVMFASGFDFFNSKMNCREEFGLTTVSSVPTKAHTGSPLKALRFSSVVRMLPLSGAMQENRSG